jgi:uncharacterized protein (DUF2236 family)
MEDMYAGGAIEVTDRARVLAAELLTPASPAPRWEALKWLNTLPTLCLLAPRFREGYGFRWGALERASARAGSALARRLVPRVPAFMRHWPACTRPVD